jgi:hypothetical protein
MNILNLHVTPPINLPRNDALQVWDDFFFPLYTHLYSQLNASSSKYPQIDFDSQKITIARLLSQLSVEQIAALRGLGHTAISKQEWNKNSENKAMQVFLWNFPEFSNLLFNIHLLAPVVLRSTEIYLGISIDAANFIQAKQFIDQINRERWNRPQNPSEQQSGVSNLGGVSEQLLEAAFGAMIDNVNFFKNTNQQVQSYGDFVMICLPNNLWISVKSNFARERFLASGFTTDILGVGFFTDKDEFTSASKIRNYQRVGFLALYLPDVSVSEEQRIANTNTYSEVVEYYTTNNINLPLNINGTAFLRPLSSIHSDLARILAISDLKNRTTLII